MKLIKIIKNTPTYYKVAIAFWTIVFLFLTYGLAEFEMESEDITIVVALIKSLWCWIIPIALVIIHLAYLYLMDYLFSRNKISDLTYTFFLIVGNFTNFGLLSVYVIYVCGMVAISHL